MARWRYDFAQTKRNLFGETFSNLQHLLDKLDQEVMAYRAKDSADKDILAKDWAGKD
jgi:hypothetical protein